jgi:hypothetical protein
MTWMDHVSSLRTHQLQDFSMAKMQRWIDLLAALLRRNYPASLDELKQDVPGYLKTPTLAALRRTFERDKDELRRFGVPLATIEDGAGEVMGYQLKREHFYLPYLTVLRDGRASSPRRVKGQYGYNALKTLSFEPDELQAIREAGVRVRRLKVAALTELAESALRKLAFDLPTDVILREEVAHTASSALHAEELVMSPPHRVSDVFEILDHALVRRKRAWPPAAPPPRVTSCPTDSSSSAITGTSRRGTAPTAR